MSSSSRSSVRAWSRLLGLSVLAATALSALRVPAATLLGPMVAAVWLAVRGTSVPVPRSASVAAQATVGVMMASHLPVSMMQEVALQWPVLLAGTLSTLLMSGALGWALARSGMLPGTTAIWGSAPGAATAMTLMSEHFGADIRLVAFMQYLRVLCCAGTSALAVHHFGAQGGQPSLHLLGPVHAAAALTAFALVAVGIALSQCLPVPGGPLLVPLVLGIATQMQGDLVFEVPHTALVICYTLLGWGIGGRFTPEVLRHAGRVFPIVLASIMTLIGTSALGAQLLVWWIDIDPLTAFLATSPGGADSVAIIAASSAVNVPFVMSMQIMRFMVVVTMGPLLARRMSRLSKR